MKSIVRMMGCIALALILSQCSFKRPVSKEQALALAKKIENSVKDDDPSVLDNIIDPDEFVSIVDTLVRHKMTPVMRMGVAKGVKKAKFGTQICTAVGDWGSYKLVKQYEKEGVQHLLFRMRGEGGVNYNDFALINKNGKLGASDVYIYLTGQLYSQTVADMMDMDEQAGVAQALKVRESDLMEIKKVLNLIVEKKYHRAKEKLDGITSDFNTSRFFRITQIRLAAAMNDTASLYSEAEMYIKNYPDAQEINFIMIDVCFKNKDYAGALDAINRLDHYIDKDPLQDYFRGLAYKMGEKKDSALVCFEKVYRTMPDVSGPYVELMVMYLKDGKINEAQKIIKEYKSNKHFDQSVFHTLKDKYPEYENYF